MQQCDKYSFSGPSIQYSHVGQNTLFLYILWKSFLLPTVINFEFKSELGCCHQRVTSWPLQWCHSGQLDKHHSVVNQINSAWNDPVLDYVLTELSSNSVNGRRIPIGPLIKSVNVQDHSFFSNCKFLGGKCSGSCSFFKL